MIAKGAIIITSDNEIGQRAVVRSGVIVPQFQIYSNPTIKIIDVKARRFNIIDSLVQNAKQQIMAQEDASIFAALDEIEKKKD